MIHRIASRLIQIIEPPTRKQSNVGSQELELISRIRAGKLTYLSVARLARLANACRAIEEARLPGIFIEAGCALGGSSILVASMKSVERPFFIYDVFGMIPQPTREDTQDVHERYRKIAKGKARGIRGEKYYGYQANLFETVRSNLGRFGIDCEAQAVTLIKGLVQDTMKIEEPVAFAHVDVDWYAPVQTCLTRIFPNLVEGGCIILDDYHSWGGCRRATDEFLREVRGQFELDDVAGSLRITKGHPSLSERAGRTSGDG